MTSGVNQIVAGNLDIEVQFSKDGNHWANMEGSESLFSTEKWEPGHTEVVYLKISNAGTLDLNYKVLVTPVSENGGVNVNGQSFKLSNYLVFGTTTPLNTLTTYTRETARAAVGTTTGLADVNGLTRTGTMVGKTASATDVQYLALVVYMPESVGNEANYKTGTAAPSIELGIKVLATQKTAENDSFGPDYDDEAVNTPFYTAGAYYDYFEAVNVSATAGSDGSFTVEKTDTNAGVIASASGTAAPNAEVNLLVVKSSEAEKNFTITVDEGHELNGYDIKVSGQTAESLVQGKLYVGTGLENFKFYHNNVLMQVGTKGSLTNGQYCYDPTDGFVYFASTTFSPFQATYKAPVAAIGTAVYGTVQDAINAAPKNATTATVITILKDVEGGAAFGYPDSDAAAGRNVTIDFAGHSYEFKTPGMGSTGTETQAMHLSHGNTMTLKNGKISVSKDTTDILMMIMNYCDLTLENMTVDCTNVKFNYNNSICRGTLTVTGNTNFIASSATAKIFDVDGTYGKDVAVVFDSRYTGTTSGVIEYVASTGSHASTLEIQAGTFTGKITSSGNTTPSITGGTFSSDPSAYVADGYEVNRSENRYVVSEIVYWSDNAAASYATPVDRENKVVTIASAEELALFAKQVNAGTTYAGYTVKLTSDIDLNGKRWEPINGFAGIFEGNTHTIRNLEVKKNSNNVGFFGSISNATVQNLNFINASVTGGSDYKGAGVVTGNAYSGVTLRNIHVSGKIMVSSGYYVGGINGSYSYARYENCSVDGVNEDGFESIIMSTLEGDWTNYVGGICGQTGEGGKGIDGCTVKNITLQTTNGGYGIGGIAGVMQYNYSITNCHVENVKLNHVQDADDAVEWIGTLVGKDYTNNSNAISKIINCTSENVRVYVGGTVIEENQYWVLGSNHIGTYDPFEAYEANLIVVNSAVYNDAGKLIAGTVAFVGANAKANSSSLIAEGYEFIQNSDGKTYSIAPVAAE